MRLLALLQTWLAASSPFTAPAAAVPAEVVALTPREKAALVVVSGIPAPPGVAGVIVHRWERHLPRPAGALVFVDQEGGEIRAFPALPPARPASSFANAEEAFAAGRTTGKALRGAGVHVDFAPVLDSPDGPLGSRQFRRVSIGVAFARGLAAGGAGACAKHFPGLGSTPESTDAARVRGIVREREVRAFRAAVEAGVPCVMVGHAIYPKLGARRPSLEPATYRLLRRTGFEGVAITDALGVLGSPGAPLWARLAARAGADLLLYSSPRDAGRAIEALVSLARKGLLDEHVARVLAFRHWLGL